MNMKFGSDTTSVAAGRRNPENQEIVSQVQDQGEVTVFVGGNASQALTLVKREKAPYQAFPKDAAAFKSLETLTAQYGVGKVVEVTLIAA